jgi:hypothetical protein
MLKRISFLMAVFAICVFAQQQAQTQEQATPATSVVAPPAVAPPAAAPPAVAPPPAATPVAPATVPAPLVEAPAADSVAAVEPKDSMTVVLITENPIEDTPKPRKKRGQRPPKNDFSIVDVPTNFEIQARKVMPVDTDWSDDNLDEWWGRANLMVITESENFQGKVHLRMDPNGYKGEPSVNGNDYFQLYEAWAWHRGDYVNLKIGRWDNTTRFGSKTFGGYVDAKKNKSADRAYRQVSTRKDGFMSTYDPENAIQFGLNNFSENIAIDIALISSEPHLNRGDLRTYFYFKDLAGLENMNLGIGYRSNIFDEIYSKLGDVTHTVDFAFRLPLVQDIGLLKDLSLFGEFALIGLDDNPGDNPMGIGSREDNGKVSTEFNPAFPVLGGLDFSFHAGLDKIVVEAEFDNHRRNSTGGTEHVKDWQGSVYVQKKINDRFTLNLGVQSENNTKDISFAGRLQGRIN